VTRFLTVAEVVTIHDLVEPWPVINRHNLESAVGQPQQTYDGRFVYPTVLLQAAVLLRGIAQAHGFENANKRTAWICTSTFLGVNGIRLYEQDPEAVAQFVVDVTESRKSIRDIVFWFCMRLVSTV
jgi:death-on-curing protein